MHVEISYAHLEGEAKELKAISDIREYLGDEKFVTVQEILLNNLPEEESFRFQLAVFVGIDGYPATAWYKHLQAEVANRAKQGAN